MMTSTAKRRQLHDDVEQIIEALAADPSQVEDVKSMLLERKKLPGVVRLEARHRAVAVVSDDVDDMWDNVPV